MGFYRITGWIFLLLFLCGRTTAQTAGDAFEISHGAIIRGDQTEKNIALVFTGDAFGDGGESIATSLQKQHIRASFS